MKVTSTINFSKTANGWSGIKKHVEHDPNVEHSNKDILENLTQYNVNGRVFSQAEIDQKMEKYFGDYVRKHDQNAIKSRHPERVFGSVKKFLKSKKKITVVATVGDMENRNQLIEQLCPKGSYESIDIPSSPDGKTLVITNSEVAKKFYGVYEKALGDFVSTNYKMNGAQLFNYFVPGAYSIHVDEAGAPHIHYELYATGKTRNGRVSNSLNQTLVNFYERATGEKEASGREALKWYRSVFDRKMARILEREFRKEYPDKFKGLEFYRKGTKDVGRSMEQVKNIKNMEDKVQGEREQLEFQKIELDEKGDVLDELERQITKVADEIEPDRPTISPEEEVRLSRSPESYGHWDEENERQISTLPYVFEWLKEFVRKLKERWEKLLKREQKINRYEELSKNLGYKNLDDALTKLEVKKPYEKIINDQNQALQNYELAYKIGLSSRIPEDEILRKEMFDRVTTEDALLNSEFELRQQIDAYFADNNKLPWTKDTKVPEDQKELLNQIAKQYPTKENTNQMQFKHNKGRER